MSETTQDHKILSDSQIRSKRYSIIDSYKTYPYKTRSVKKILSGKENGRYYVKKDEMTSHKFTLDYFKYKEIVNDVFLHMWEDIKKGKIISIPYLGKFGFKRYKTSPNTKVINWGETKKQYGEWNKNNPNNKKIVYFDNYHTHNWAIKTYWEKPRNVIELWYYKFIFVRSCKTELATELKDKPDLIFNFEQL